MDEKTKIHRIAYECDDTAQAVAIVNSIAASETLYELLDHYNWDDGFAVPTAIADHPACDLAIALRLYWLAASDYWHDPEAEVNEYNLDNFNFSKMIEERILSGAYKVGALSHSENFNRVAIHGFRKRGLPAVLYEPVVVQ